MEKIVEVLPSTICSSDDDNESHGNSSCSGREDAPTRDYHNFPVVRPRAERRERRRAARKRRGQLVKPTVQGDSLPYFLKSDYVERLVQDVNGKFQPSRSNYKSPCYVKRDGRQVAQIDVPTALPLAPKTKMEEMAATNTLLSACLKQSGIDHELRHGRVRILKNMDKLAFLKNGEQLCSRVTNFDWGIFTSLTQGRRDQKFISDKEAASVGAIIPESDVDREKQIRAFRDFDMVLAAGLLANIELLNIVYSFFLNFNRNGGFGMRYSWIDIDGKVVSISPSPVMIDFNYGDQTKSVPSPTFPIIAMDKIVHPGEKDYHFEFITDDGRVSRPGWSPDSGRGRERAQILS